MATKRQTKRFLKRFSPIALLGLIAALVLGFFCGSFALKAITKNDGFVLNGDKSVTLTVGQSYTFTETGYSLRAFGKDETSLVVVSHSDAFTKNPDGTYTLDTSEEGVYGIFYTAPTSKKYGEIRRVRTFTVSAQGGES